METNKIFDANFYRKNRNRLLDSLPTNSIAFVVSADTLPRNGDQNFPYKQNSNLLYLTGINQEQTILVLNNCNPNTDKHQILFIRNASPQEQIWEGKKLSKQEAIDISGVENIKFSDEFDSLISDLMYYADNVFIATNENLKYRRFYDDADYRFYKKLRFQYPFHSYRRLSPIITRLRLRKQPQEIEAIRKAIDFTNKAFMRVLKIISPRVRENDILAEIYYEFIKNNVRNFSFEPIIASGANTCTLHYTQNNDICNSGDLLLMDFGAEYHNYAADITRTVPVSGKFDKFQLQVYNKVLEIQQFAKKQLTVGTTIEHWNKQVKTFAGEKLAELGLIASSQIYDFGEISKYYLHGTGHFLGLDVHDVGTNATPLEPGMVLTVEPGIYIPNKNIGIRLENDVVITNTGIDDLSDKVPILPNDIERLMSF